MIIYQTKNHYRLNLQTEFTKYHKSLLLDTGATTSVISMQSVAFLFKTDKENIRKYLRGVCKEIKYTTVASGEKIESFPCYLRNVCIEDFHLDYFSFLVVDVGCDVVGMDFINCCEMQFHIGGSLELLAFNSSLYNGYKHSAELCLLEEYAYSKYYSWFNALTEKQKEHLKYHWAVVYNCCVEGNFKDVAGILDGCVISDYPVGNAYE